MKPVGPIIDTNTIEFRSVFDSYSESPQKSMQKIEEKSQQPVKASEFKLQV
jgi:hypothetical protein